MCTKPTLLSLAGLALLSLVPGACEKAPLLEGNGGEITVDPQVSSVWIDKDRLTVRPRTVRLYSGWDPEVPDDRWDPMPGALWMSAWPADWSYKFPHNARLSFGLKTTGGDAETLVLRGPEGPCWGRAEIGCFSFKMVLEGVDHAYELLPEMERISARYFRVSIEADSTVTAWVGLLDGDTDPAIATAREWPGVLAVDLLIAQIFTQNLEPVRHGFYGGLAVEFATPVPGDGKLQVQPGDTLTVEYRQPDGTMLTATATL